MHIDRIKKRLNTIKSNFKIDKKTVLFRYRMKSNNNWETTIRKIMNEDYFIYISEPKQKKKYAGFGLAQKISNYHDLNNFNICSNKKNDEVQVFGGMSFNMKKKANFPWKSIPKSLFYIPKIEINNNEIIYSKIINDDFNENNIIDDICKCISIIEKSKNSKPYNANAVNKENIPLKEKYFGDIKNVKNKIKKNFIKKIVISRIEKHTFAEIPNISNLIEKIDGTYPECFNFTIRFCEGHYFFGSTPEKIISKNNDRFSTEALAGTAENSKELKNPKDIDEHNFVIKHLIKRLGKISNKIEKAKSETLKLNYAYHILTKIKGTSKMHILDIMHEIFPTPALCGTPQKETLKMIDSIESFDRGWYGGVIGYYDKNGNGNFHVPIRSGLMVNNEIFLYAGSGIVNESTAENEWNETELKFSHLRAILR